MLLLDENGRINQYRNGALQTLSALPAEAWRGESLPLERLAAIGEMTHRLLNHRGYDEFGPDAAETADRFTVFSTTATRRIWRLGWSLRSSCTPLAI